MATTKLPRMSSVNHVVWLNTVVRPLTTVVWHCSQTTFGVWRNSDRGITSALDQHVNDNMTAVFTYHTHTADRVIIVMNVYPHLDRYENCFYLLYVPSVLRCHYWQYFYQARSLPSWHFILAMILFWSLNRVSCCCRWSVCAWPFVFIKHTHTQCTGHQG